MIIVRGEKKTWRVKRETVIILRPFNIMKILGFEHLVPFPTPIILKSLPFRFITRERKSTILSGFIHLDKRMVFLCLIGKFDGGVVFL
jgi:hypothetical protein